MLNKFSMPCAICRTKNEVRNDLSRIKNIANKINQSVRSATEEDKKKRTEYLMKNRYVYNIFDYHKKCSYGIHCTEVSSDVNNFKFHSKSIVEDLVLLAIMDIDEAKTYIREFCGYFPKAARFLETFYIE